MDQQPTVPPDTKDWTWVLERPCPECGFVSADVEPGALPTMIRENADRWRTVLTGEDVALRPIATVWSPLEYACHVRDVHRTMLRRVTMMLEEDEPTFPNWDQDATAVEGRYGEQDPSVVAEELAAAAEEAAAVYDHVTGEAWERPGLRSNGSRFTVDSLGRYHLHDVVHHLYDVGAGRPR